jgi:hypothetical protein
VINKSDLLLPEEAVAKAQAIVKALRYRGPAFLISGATRTATGELCEAVMRFLETGEAPARGNLEVPEIARAVRADPSHTAARRRSGKPARKPAKKGKKAKTAKSSARRQTVKRKKKRG